MQRKIIHIDCDCFYASVEMRDDSIDQMMDWSPPTSCIGPPDSLHWVRRRALGGPIGAVFHGMSTAKTCGECAVEQMIDETATAKLLGVSKRTLQGWRWRGGGPPFLRIGMRAIRYDPCALRAWIEEQRRTSTSDLGADSKP